MPDLDSLRILQFVPEALPTFRPDVATLFGKYLPRHGVVCDLVGHAGEGDPRQPGFASVRAAGGRGGRLRRELAFTWRCASILMGMRRGDCDAVQVRDMVPLALLALVITRLKGVPFIFWLSFLMSEGRIERARPGGPAGGPWRRRLVLAKGLFEKWLLYRLVLPRCRHVFVQSKAMRDHVARQGVPAGLLTPVPMGVDTEVVRPEAFAAGRLDGWEGLPVIAYLGTLDCQRRLDVLVDALALVRRRYATARLLFVGDGVPADRRAITARVAALKLDEAVHISGWLPSEQAWRLVKGADVALSPFPRGEILDTNSPTKVIEYLALALPCVGNDNPDQAETLLQSGAGWLAEASPEGYAKAIMEVLDDPAAARLRAARGPAYIAGVRGYGALARDVAQTYFRVLRGAQRSGAAQEEAGAQG